MVKDVLWDVVRRIKWTALAAGILLFPLLLWLWRTGANDIVVATVRVTNTWSWIIAVFGFSSQYLNKPSNVLAYQNRAVYPFYILHQTVLLVVAYHLMNLNMPIASKFLILTVGTFGCTWLIYEFLIRRFGVFALPFGLRTAGASPHPAKVPPK